MKKAIVVAALVAASFAPALPVQAATLTSGEVANCLIFPIFKAECWDKGAELATAAPKAIVAAAGDAAATPPTVKVPVGWWNCTAAPAGSGHMYDC